MLIYTGFSINYRSHFNFIGTRKMEICNVKKIKSTTAMNYATSFPGSISSSFLGRPREAEEREPENDLNFLRISVSMERIQF